MAKRRKIRKKFKFKLKPGLVADIWGSLFIILAIFVLASLFASGGILGKYVIDFLKKILGISTYIIPLILALIGLGFFIRSEKIKRKSLILGLTTVIICISSLVHLNVIDKFNTEMLPRAGGYIGAGISFFLEKYIGKPASFVLLFLILGLAIIISLQVSFKDLYQLTIGKFKDLIKLRAKARKEKTRIVPTEKGVVKAERLVKDKSSKKPVIDIVTHKKSVPEPEGEKELKKGQYGLERKEYIFPPLNLLKLSSPKIGYSYKKEVNLQAEAIEKTLRNFGVEVHIARIIRGPTVTRFEIELASGVKVNQVLGLSKDFTLALGTQNVRILTPVPGKPVMGVEVPNKERQIVTLGDVLLSDEGKKRDSAMTVGLGKDITGKSILINLAEMPHLLIAGATGSGKTSCINNVITSILFKARPDEVKMILIDPKMVELGYFNDIPHLLVPVITDARKASSALGWIIREMEERFKKLSKARARNIDLYNEMIEKETEKGDDEVGKKLSRDLVIIDELADLMLVAPNEVEEGICRIAQMGRAVGIHLIVATQRPSVDIITGLIKANIPSRISFAVFSQADSRVILDTAGADKLIGNGDMLYLPINASRSERIQGGYVTEKEIKEVVEFVKTQGEPHYEEEIIEEKGLKYYFEEKEDPLLDEAMQIVVNQGKASTSLLQRRLRIGYSRAARLLDTMEEKGIIGEVEGNKPRTVLITIEEFERMRGREKGSPRE